MGNALENAKAHWSEKISGGPRKVEVPEWGDDSGPLEFFVHPPNLKQRAKLLQKYDENDLTSLADVVLFMAKDSNGLPMFSPADRGDLTSNVDPVVVARVARQIMDSINVSDADVEDAVKN